jgi:hypothetical protein
MPGRVCREVMGMAWSDPGAADAAAGRSTVADTTGVAPDVI